jgi:hypothetical protein
VSLDPATGVIGSRHGVKPGILGEHGCDHLRSDHVIGLAVEVVQVDAVALLVPHDADEFPATTWAQGPFCGAVPCAAPLPPNAALASGGGGLSLERRELRYAGLCRGPESLDLCLVHRHRSPECLKDNWTRREETATPLSVGNFRPRHTTTSHRELQPREMGGTSAWLGRRSDSDTRVMLRSGSKVPSGLTLCGQSAGGRSTGTRTGGSPPAPDGALPPSPPRSGGRTLLIVTEGGGREKNRPVTSVSRCPAPPRSAPRPIERSRHQE